MITERYLLPCKSWYKRNAEITLAFTESSQQPFDVGSLIPVLHMEKKQKNKTILSPLDATVFYLLDILPSLGFHAL